MKKMTAKPARSQEHAGARILYGESDEDVLKQQSAAFKRAGYNVEHAIGRLAIEAALKNGRYEAVVLGHTLSKDDRHHLPYMAKKTNCNVRVLVLHASGKHPAVDFALDSRQGDEAVLDALASLLTLSAAAVA